MCNTLFEGDFVIVYNKNVIRKNDVVVCFRDKQSRFYIKRCIALDNDYVRICGGNIFVNNKDITPKFSKYLYKVYFNDSLKLVSSFQNMSDYCFESQKSVNDLAIYLTKNQTRLLNNKMFVDSIVPLVDRMVNNASSNFIPDLSIADSNSSRKYFLLGDNLLKSIDSRIWGTIPKENIIGKATLVLFNYHNGKFRWDRFLKKIE